MVNPELKKEIIKQMPSLIEKFSEYEVERFENSTNPLPEISYVYGSYIINRLVKVNSMDTEFDVLFSVTIKPIRSKV